MRFQCHFQSQKLKNYVENACEGETHIQTAHAKRKCNQSLENRTLDIETAHPKRKIDPYEYKYKTSRRFKSKLPSWSHLSKYACKKCYLPLCDFVHVDLFNSPPVVPDLQLEAGQVHGDGDLVRARVQRVLNLEDSSNVIKTLP
jgi:hypothetical protein